MLVAFGGSVIAPQPDPLSELCIICRNSSALTASSEILPGIKTEAAGDAKRSCFSAFILRAVGLACVFNNRDSMMIGDLLNRVHVRYLLR